MFRQYPGSGSFGGRVWGPRCIFFAYSRTAIWALFAKQEGHQIASTITTCTRTNEEPCIPGPLCSCTDTDLFWTLLPAGRSNFGGSPRTNRPTKDSPVVAARQHRFCGCSAGPFCSCLFPTHAALGWHCTSNACSPRSGFSHCY